MHSLNLREHASDDYYRGMCVCMHSYERPAESLVLPFDVARIHFSQVELSLLGKPDIKLRVGTIRNISEVVRTLMESAC